MPLEAADVVQVHVGDEDRPRHVAVLGLEGGQAFGAAVDGEPGRAIALDCRHRRAQRHRRGVADPGSAATSPSQYPRFQARSWARRRRAKSSFTSSRLRSPRAACATNAAGVARLASRQAVAGMRSIAAVEVDQPTVAVAIEQDVVGVGVGMVEPGAMEARDQPTGLLPRRAVRGHQGAVGKRTHTFEPLHQDRRAVAQALAHIEGGQRPGTGSLRAISARISRNSAKLRVRLAPCPRCSGRGWKRDHHAAAQVLPQHAVAERRIDEPGAAAATTSPTGRALSPQRAGENSAGSATRRR